MSRKIIGVTVGTTISADRMGKKIKPVKTVNGIAPDVNGNVNVGGAYASEPYNVNIAIQYDSQGNEYYDLDYFDLEELYAAVEDGRSVACRMFDGGVVCLELALQGIYLEDGYVVFSSVEYDKVITLTIDSGGNVIRKSFPIPASGGASGGANGVKAFEYTATAEQNVNGFTVNLPVPVNRFYMMNFRIELPNGVTLSNESSSGRLYTMQGNTNYVNLMAISKDYAGINLFFIKTHSTGFRVGTTNNALIDNLGLSMGNTGVGASNKTSITFYIHDTDAFFNAGAIIKVWGLYSE